MESFDAGGEVGNASDYRLLQVVLVVAITARRLLIQNFVREKIVPDRGSPVGPFPPPPPPVTHTRTILFLCCLPLTEAIKGEGPQVPSAGVLGVGTGRHCSLALRLAHSGNIYALQQWHSCWSGLLHLALSSSSSSSSLSFSAFVSNPPFASATYSRQRSSSSSSF